MVKEFLVITASDFKYGDFLINHWLKSLKANVNLNKTDIAVLDYGLSPEQRIILRKENVRMVKCKKDGHIVNIRFRDLENFLKSSKYKQILSCDGGDIIFQKNIDSLFLLNPRKFKAAFENMPSKFIEYLIEQKPFNKDLEEKIIKTLKNKKIINGGLIIGPQKEFRELCGLMIKNIKNTQLYGPDQVILNYYLYKTGFVSLDSKFNYVIMNNEGLKVKEGVFYDKNNEEISVVHNAGGIDFLRAVRNFGYGQEYNQFSIMRYKIFRFLVKADLLKLPRLFLKFKNKLFTKH